jgi:hypothetical protein
MLAEKRFKFAQLHSADRYPYRYIVHLLSLRSTARNRHPGPRHPNVT